jgi:hypothetical protein
MIPVTTVISRIQSALDAEGFDHYKFDEDFKPAINYAQDWLTQLYSRVMSDKKYSEEMLRNVSYLRVWQTSDYSRINFLTTDIGGDLWSILGVFPEAETQGITGVPVGYTYEYSLFTTLRYVSSDYAATRTTFEKKNINKGNPFSNGNNVVTGDLKSYNYISFSNYSDGTTISEIEISPKIARVYVGVAYLLQPTEITATTDTIKYPQTLLPLIVNKALNFISWKQGDRTNLKGVTDADIQQLITLTT